MKKSKSIPQSPTITLNNTKYPIQLSDIDILERLLTIRTRCAELSIENPEDVTAAVRETLAIIGEILGPEAQHTLAGREPITLHDALTTVGDIAVQALSQLLVAP